MNEDSLRLIRPGLPQSGDPRKPAFFLVILMLLSISNPVAADSSISRDDFDVIDALMKLFGEMYEKPTYEMMEIYEHQLVQKVHEKLTGSEDELKRLFRKPDPKVEWVISARMKPQQGGTCWWHSTNSAVM